MDALVEYIAKSLVDEPDEVEITVREEGTNIYIELRVAPNDAGRIIGKDGRVANAIRSLVRSVGSRDGLRVNIKIV